VFGLFKKKREIPDFTPAINATVHAVVGVMKIQINLAQGSCAYPGPAKALLAATFAYGFLDGMAQTNGCFESWAAGSKLPGLIDAGYMAALGSIMLSAFDDGIEHAEALARLSGTVLRCGADLAPMFMKPGQEGIAFARRGEPATSLARGLLDFDAHKQGAPLPTEAGAL
jgi:hypothetical protein